MKDVMKSASLYTVYAAIVGATLQGFAVLFQAGGTVATDAFRIASTMFAAG